MVRYTIEKKALGASSGKDKRGSHSPWNKLSDSQKQKVKKHIESFPVIDSHYQRMGTKRQFLGANLSIQKMYDLYKEKCVEDGELPVKHSMYRNIFCNEYNLSFHHPKKDPCETCNKFMEKKITNAVTYILQNEHDAHIKRKELAREKKKGINNHLNLMNMFTFRL